MKYQYSDSTQINPHFNAKEFRCKCGKVHAFSISNELVDMQCHAEIPQAPKRKAKKFCCDKCRQLWWTAHSNLIHCVSLVNHTCPVCGKTFQAYKSKHRIYCSRTCYGKSKEVTHE